MKKIPKKHTPLAGGALMAVLMGFIMSGIVTAINVRIPENFISIWMNAFVRVVPIAFLAVLIVKPIVEYSLKKISE